MTVDQAEAKYLSDLREHAALTRTLLSNRGRTAREKAVCRAFLRTLGVSFNEGELVAPTDEPADVEFRSCRFQVREILDRKRGDDWKEREARYARATCIEDILEPSNSAQTVIVDDLLLGVQMALEEKARRYGAGCQFLDALVYVDLTIRLLITEQPWSAVEGLKMQGWRSVSLLLPPSTGLVVLATEDATKFLQHAEGQRSMAWPDVENLFDPI